MSWLSFLPSDVGPSLDPLTARQKKSSSSIPLLIELIRENGRGKSSESRISRSKRVIAYLVPSIAVREVYGMRLVCSVSKENCRTAELENEPPRSETSNRTILKT